MSVNKTAAAIATMAAASVGSKFGKFENRTDRKKRQRDDFVKRLRANRSHKFFSETPNYRDPETRQQVRAHIKPWRGFRREFLRMHSAPATRAQQREVARRPSFSVGAAMNAKARL